MAYRNKPRKLSVIIPSTPVSTQTATDDTANDNDDLCQHFSRQNPSPAPLKHPYRPSTVIKQEPKSDTVDLNLKAQDIASPELLAIANLFNSMKGMVHQMTRTFDALGDQSQRMSSLAVEAKRTEEIQKVKRELGQQIARQEAEMQKLRQRLEGEVRMAVEDRLRSKLSSLIQGHIANLVEERVRQELSMQVPPRLHSELGLSGIVNDTESLLPEAGELQFNSVSRLSSSEDNRPVGIPTFVIEEIGDHIYPSSHTPRPLRPFLRPLPTPEQSPAYAIQDSLSSKSTSCCSTPTSAYPNVPAPTPIVSSAPTLMVPMRNGPGVLSPVPPTPSPLAPRDLNSLFALSSDKFKSLSWCYDLDGFALPSPISEWPKARTVVKSPSTSSLWSSPLLTPPLICDNFVNWDTESQYKDPGIPTLRVETPVLMIPPPLSQPRAGNSMADNLRLLPPLIIN